MKVGVGGAGPEGEIFERRELRSQLAVYSDDFSHFYHSWFHREFEVTDVDWFFGLRWN